MAISPEDMNEIRVGVLGVSVDTTHTGPGGWTGVPPANANVLAPAVPDRIINRAINAINGSVNNALAGTNAFSVRFSHVVGAEATTDQAAFEYITSRHNNLIRAVAALVEGDGSGGDGVVRRHVHQQPEPETSWVITHDLGERLVAVQLVDEAGRTMLTDIDFHSDDALTVHFAVPKAGTAVIRR